MSDDRDGMPPYVLVHVAVRVEGMDQQAQRSLADACHALAEAIAVKIEGEDPAPDSGSWCGTSQH